jgi:hypothetical protein
MTVITRRPASLGPQAAKAVIKEARGRQRRRRIRLALLLVIATGATRLVLLPALVAGVFAPTASAELPNPCTQLTNPEAAKVHGSKIEFHAEVTSNGRYRMCKWTGVNLASPKAYVVLQRTLLVQLSASTAARFEKDAKQIQGAVRVAGVGESAWTSNSVIHELNVEQSGYALWITAGLVIEPLQTEKAAAKIAVKHL